jgi:hypothetical protein
MGIAEMTVKCKAEDFCKFSVTFWVDNEIGAANSAKRAKYIFREWISPLKTHHRRAYGSGTNIFLTGNFSGCEKNREERAREFFVWRARKKLFCATAPGSKEQSGRKAPPTFQIPGRNE